MTFKDQIDVDITEVFINIDEFATEHLINGVPIQCVVDDDRLVNRTDLSAVGTQLGEKLLFVKAENLAGKPLPESRIELDGKPWFVRSVIDSMGVYEIRLAVAKT